MGRTSPDISRRLAQGVTHDHHPNWREIHPRRVVGGRHKHRHSQWHALCRRVVVNTGAVAVLADRAATVTVADKSAGITLASRPLAVAVADTRMGIALAPGITVIVTKSQIQI